MSHFRGKDSGQCPCPHFFDKKYRYTNIYEMKMVTSREILKILPQIIKKSRIGKYTQKELSEITGIPQSRISLFENGKELPSLVQFINLHIALKFDPKMILRLAEKEFNNQAAALAREARKNLE